MLTLGLTGRIWICLQPQDGRKSFDGLAEAEAEGLRGRVERLATARGSLENRRLRAEAELEQADAQFRAVGGKHWEARQARAGRQGGLQARFAEVESRHVGLAAGELPLALVPDLLARVRGQDDLERHAAEAAIVQELLDDRDGRLLARLREARAAAKVIKVAEDFLEADRRARQPGPTAGLRLNLSERARAQVEHLAGGTLAGLRAEAESLLATRAGVRQELDDVERSLAITPEDAEVGAVVDRLKGAAQRLAKLNDEAGRLDAELVALRADLADREIKRDRLLQEDLDQEFEREDAARMAGLAGRTRSTMQEFLRKATGRKIDRLSGLITESFRYLLRKKTLVERILIDPADFAITLYDASGWELTKQRLSEGEKQIFAISVLWGLARAAPRPLPAVVDTPMARLDAAHRRNPIELYFPNASHQVVILSTDTEVDRAYYETLRPHVARAYHLDYDESERATTAREEYFWKDMPDPLEFGAAS